MTNQDFTLNSKLKLLDKNEIPILGLGTYEMDGKEAYKAVKWALEAGYRHIDTAAWYANEKECGQAIRDFCASSGVPRYDIFYTTKLRSNDGYERATRAIQASVDICGLEYIDLYLVHSPLGGSAAREQSWRAVCDAQKRGVLRSIGVSNFGVEHMRELLGTGLPTPAVNQVDLHPFMTRIDIVGYAREHDIALEAWAPLVRGLRFRHPAIVSQAKKHARTPAQVLLRYSLQKGFIAIPKSISRARIVENAQIFDFALTEEDVTALDRLDEGLVTDWDPTECP